MIYLSVVSHGHLDIIRSLDSLPQLAKDDDFKICIKDNLNSHELHDYCKSNNIDYITTNEMLGFGANNNVIYEYYSNEIKEDDYFVILNPDVKVDSTTLKKAIDKMALQHINLATINLFRNEELTIYDNSIRKFPSLIDFVKSYMIGKNTTIIDKSKIHQPEYVDWAAGSFLIFKSDLFKKLKGFNETYFMYCEDIDICWRANKHYSERVLYYPDLMGIHYAQFSNRRFFSKHFFWHVKSIVTFLTYKYGIRREIKSKIM
ncbi:glycosyltransferase family 2 protein [Enterobacter hormaechei]|uniref:glycosyltransferase family 2 protein n=1 Tax=Enterobacter hormaechei TaxID=158836 RepID=UPI0032B0C979